MNEPIWIEKQDCLGFHEQLLSRFGGLSGIRDEGLLESALNRPLQLFHYENPSIFELAAAYAHGIVKNHPFLDGNKRSGLMAAALFLESNGWDFEAPEEEAVLQTLALAAGETGAADYAAWLARSCSPRQAG
jgi:death-on-curing protein